MFSFFIKIQRNLINKEFKNANTDLYTMKCAQKPSLRFNIPLLQEL